jgi:hypothetical protein
MTHATFISGIIEFYYINEAVAMNQDGRLEGFSLQPPAVGHAYLTRIASAWSIGFL